MEITISWVGAAAGSSEPNATPPAPVPPTADRGNQTAPLKDQHQRASRQNSASVSRTARFGRILGNVKWPQRER